MTDDLMPPPETSNNPKYRRGRRKLLLKLERLRRQQRDTEDDEEQMALQHEAAFVRNELRVKYHTNPHHGPTNKYDELWLLSHPLYIDTNTARFQYRPPYDGMQALQREVAVKYHTNPHHGPANKYDELWLLSHPPCFDTNTTRFQYRPPNDGMPALQREEAPVRENLIAMYCTNEQKQDDDQRLEIPAISMDIAKRNRRVRMQLLKGKRASLRHQQHIVHLQQQRRNRTQQCTERQRHRRSLLSQEHRHEFLQQNTQQHQRGRSQEQRRRPPTFRFGRIPISTHISSG